MKPTKLHRTFIKHFRQRIAPKPKLVVQFGRRLTELVEGRPSDLLKDHSLSGAMHGLRAFSVTGDIRVIYRESEHERRLLDIGSHNQVY